MDGKPAERHRPLNIAHRGASRAAPENTLTAFRKAVELGADSIEFDVRLSGDGVPVVIHNATVDATTDGKGAVAEMDLSKLRTLDAGGWFDRAFERERIPTLEEVLEHFGRRTKLNLELKEERVLNRALVPAVVNLLEQRELDQEVLVSCFNPYLLRQVRRLTPTVPLAVLYAKSPLPLRLLANLFLGEHPDAIHPHHTMVNAPVVAHAHALGLRVHAWTVDERERMEALTNAGVDGIITNRPGLLRKVLEG